MLLNSYSERRGKYFIVVYAPGMVIDSHSIIDQFTGSGTCETGPALLNEVKPAVHLCTSGASANSSCTFETCCAPVKRAVNLWNQPCTPDINHWNISYWCETGRAPVKRFVHLWKGSCMCETQRACVKSIVPQWNGSCTCEKGHAPLK